jgi:membrane protease subunit (stomatin/prohibitin family)
MKRSIIDFIRWDGEIGVLAYRHPKINISKYAKLQVNEAQEAIVVVNGTKSQKFGPGQYDMDSPNYPILRAFYGLPFGGENPFTVQVWFVNKLTPKDVDWGIGGFPIYDQTFQAQIPIEAHGKYGISVSDAERLILKLALGYPTNSEGAIRVTADHFTEHLRGELTAKTKSIITKVFATNRYGINEISAHLEEISNNLAPELNSFFEDFGCVLSKFYVTTIGVDTTTEAGRITQEAINQQTAQKISGHTWQQSKIFETAQKAVNNSQGGGILGAVMMAGMFGGMGGNGNMGIMNPEYGQPTPAPVGGVQPNMPGCAQPMVREVYCSRCSKKFTSDNKFCPHCGDQYNPCPKCGADNDISATRCVTCGSPIVSNQMNVCPNCRSSIAPGMAFCPVCGRPVSEQKCPRCGASTNGAAFCHNCGMKVK